MKRLLSINVILALMALPFFSCQVFAEETAEPSFSPTIIYVEGTVNIVAPDGAETKAQKGAVLVENTRVKTADQSYCDIAFDSAKKNIVSLGPNSDVKIGKDFKQINISKGRVFSELKGLAAGSTFEVVTPQAIAGVRGTAWESIVDAITQFNIQDNIVYVQGVDPEGNLTPPVDIGEGNSILVDQAGALGQLTALSEEDTQRMSEWSNRIDSTLNTGGAGNSGDKKIKNYQGASANLFEEVMEEEGNAEEGAFAANSDPEFLNVGNDFEQGTPGGDVTQTTFTPPTETPPEPELPELPEIPEPSPPVPEEQPCIPSLAKPC